MQAEATNLSYDLSMNNFNVRPKKAGMNRAMLRYLDEKGKEKTVGDED